MADVSGTLRQWSGTAGSNNPTQATTIGSGLSDNLQTMQAVVRKYLASYGSNIATAATMDLTTMDGYVASVTGNVTVTGLGTEAAGISYLLVFASNPVFKNSATLILGGSDITFAAGDIAEFTAEGSGTARLTRFYPTGGVTGTGGPVRATSPSIASPSLTGTPTAPTAPATTSTTQIATTAFVTGISAPTLRVFTSTGAWSKPANLKHIIVRCIGGGGGGGHATNSSTGIGSAGGGGAGGGYVEKYITAASLAASVTATVGGGGSPDNPGGTSAFQGQCTATGGGAGAAGGLDSAGAGGNGGIGVNGDINGAGSGGSSGLVTTFNAVNTIIGGAGGGSAMGGGGAGNTAPNVGNPGVGIGGGASGGVTTAADNQQRAGGSGTNGIVIIYEYYI